MRAFHDLPPMVTQSRFRAGDGEHIHYAVTGLGPPVVLLHGWTSDHREWVPYAREIADLRRAYCWDARGHGGHRLASHAHPTVQRMAQDLREMIGTLGLERPALLGHSMGALTIWEYLRQFGCADISRLVLVDQSPKLVTQDDWDLGVYGLFPSERNEDFVRRLREDFAEGVLELAAYGKNVRARRRYEENSKGFQRSRQQLRALDPGPLISIWQSLATQDYRSVLPAITVPVLLVYGDESNFYGVETAHYVQRSIPDARLEIYAGADHSPHQWQRERFVRELRGFLGGES